jgi:hypothetical protein
MLALAAAAWPGAVNAFGYLLATPYERALRAAWCGGASHDALAIVGHCALCWAGAALLAAAAIMVVTTPHKTALIGAPHGAVFRR